MVMGIGKSQKKSRLFSFLVCGILCIIYQKFVKKKKGRGGSWEFARRKRHMNRQPGKPPTAAAPPHFLYEIDFKNLLRPCSADRRPF